MTRLTAAEAAEFIEEMLGVGIEAQSATMIEAWVYGISPDEVTDYLEDFLDGREIEVGTVTAHEDTVEGSGLPCTHIIIKTEASHAVH